MRERECLSCLNLDSFFSYSSISFDILAAIASIWDLGWVCVAEVGFVFWGQ